MSPLETPAGRRPARMLPRYARTWRGAVGTAILALVLLAAVLGPLLAPHAIDEPIGPPGSGPGSGHLLGTDLLGRDVLSRVLSGGWSVIWVASVSVALTYLLAIALGVLTGLSSSRSSEIAMRCLDLLIVFPPLLLLLVLVAGAGTNVTVLIAGVVLVAFPGAARLVRASTQEVATAGYVEAAQSRGEGAVAIGVREVLPNIVPALLADAGVRFLSSIFLIAGLNFLGVGAQPPAADWSLMIAENRQLLQINPLAVLAPALLLAMLTISTNLVADAYVHTLDRSKDAS